VLFGDDKIVDEAENVDSMSLESSPLLAGVPVTDEVAIFLFIGVEGGNEAFTCDASVDLTGEEAFTSGVVTRGGADSRRVGDSR
jgi:hypothetical protein